MTYLVVGAPSGVGRSVAETLAAEGEDLVLVSRDKRDSSAQAEDLFYRFNVRTKAIALDLARLPHEFAELDSALESLGNVNGIIITAGSGSENDSIGNLEVCADVILTVNFLSVCHCIEHLLPRLYSADRPVVVGIGSVAACRGRSRNVMYAAAKRALQSYFESLRHAVEGSGIRVQFYRLGYVETNLAFGQRLLLPSASPAAVARRIVSNLSRRSGSFSYPRFWYAICLLLRVMPWAVFRQLRR
jgi:short-subunit dehydrogenase